jgi:hypothetical protein
VTEAKEVRMGVDDAGDDSSAVQIDEERRRTGERFGFGIGADESDPSAADRERRHDWT